MNDIESLGYYQEAMPWDGSCFHRWVNFAFYGVQPIQGYERGCLLCKKTEKYMYQDRMGKLPPVQVQDWPK